MGFKCGCGREHDEAWVFEDGEIHWPKKEWDETMDKYVKKLAEDIDQMVLDTILKPKE